jgi:hypothetical protein
MSAHPAERGSPLNEQSSNPPLRSITAFYPIEGIGAADEERTRNAKLREMSVDFEN